jgi:hypothetical protein
VPESPHLAPAAAPDRTPEARIAELEGQLAESRLEVLRLRDELIGAEAELGVARGTITSLRAQLSAYAGIPEAYHQTVNSTTWRLMWLVMTPYRKVRERQAAQGRR